MTRCGGGVTHRTEKARVASRQRGSASVFAMVLVAVLSVVTVLLAAVGAAIADQRRVASAADLAALAGAASLQQGEDGCGAARAVARINAARLSSCVVTGTVVTLRASRQTQRLLGRRLEVTAAARAGPVDAAGLASAPGGWRRSSAGGRVGRRPDVPG